jgi:hypothetical protein
MKCMIMEHSLCDFGANFKNKKNRIPVNLQNINMIIILACLWDC